MRLLRGYCHRISAVPTGAENIQKPHKMLVNCAFLVVAAMQTPHIAPLRLQRPCVRIAPGVPKCVDERCNAENAARKCGVFTYNALFLERKSCKKLDFSKFQFCPARGDLFKMRPAEFMVWCDSNTKAEKQRKPAAAVSPAPLLACEAAACPIRWESDT